MKWYLAGLPLCALVGCANPPAISANPVVTGANAIPGTSGIVTTVQTGLLNAEWNLDQAIVVGALPANDPADACLHASLKQIGIEPVPAGAPPATPPASFTPRVTDLVSEGAVLYIEAQQAKKLVGGGAITIDPSCKALIGQFVLDAGSVAQIVKQPLLLLPRIQ